MKTNWKRPMMLFMAGLIGGGLAFAAAQKNAARDRGGSQTVQVVVDPTPPARDGRMASSYAGVVKKASPSVVNIFTTKTIRNPMGPGGMPFFNDPMFRRFFGDRFGEGFGSTPRPFQQRSLGSGVIVSKDGYILTNNHVVDGADEIQVAREASRDEYTARVVGRDPRTDLAVLKIDARDLPAATFADSDLVEVGDVVLAIGNPFGIGQTVTLGIVSAVGRGGMGIEDYEDFIQTDAAINPGNSGGALVDAAGRLVGVNTAILSQSGGNHGVGFAIPANLARSVMDQLIENGRVRRGFLGVGIQDLTPDLAKEFGVDARRGVLVTEVTEGSAAADAGLQRGDVILAVNGKPAEDSRTLRLLVGQAQPGAKLELRLQRDRREMTLKATLKAAPGDSEGTSRGTGPAPGADGEDTGALQGVAVGDLTPAVRRQQDIPPRLQGAIITSVDPESASYRAGLRSGDVILEINRKPVRSADEAVEACRAAEGNRTLVSLWRDGAHRYVVVVEQRR